MNGNRTSTDGTAEQTDARDAGPERSEKRRRRNKAAAKARRVANRLDAAKTAPTLAKKDLTIEIDLATLTRVVRRKRRPGPADR
ncbi:MAG: hypothetical protein H6874_00090 [Hyphomicrobiaceae bacterium]|nr:hypothetical protein [Hyphomicrobiaceae bacterium]